MTRYGLVLLVVPCILLLTSCALLIIHISDFVFFILGISVVYFLFTCYFIRDPKRIIVCDQNAIISPADGRIVEICDDAIAGYNEPMTRISIFMSALNVHVNRIPYAGIVNQVYYNPGKYYFAHIPKASLLNEQNLVIMNTEHGHYAFRQIAGIFARRIITELSPGMTVNTGERFGMIRFGSRLDVILPKNVLLSSSLGEIVKAGESILARWHV